MLSARAIFASKSMALRLPAGDKGRVARYVHVHQGRGSVIEQAPFHRQLDAWLCAIGIAVAKGLQVDGPDSSGEKFVDTQAVEIGEAAAEMLLVLAIYHFGSQDDRIADPKVIIDLANAYAAAGTPTLLEWLESGDLRQTRIDNVVTRLDELRSTAMQGVQQREDGLALVAEEPGDFA